MSHWFPLRRCIVLDHTPNTMILWVVLREQCTYQRDTLCRRLRSPPRTMFQFRLGTMFQPGTLYTGPQQNYQAWYRKSLRDRLCRRFGKLGQHIDQPHSLSNDCRMPCLCASQEHNHRLARRSCNTCLCSLEHCKQHCGTYKHLDFQLSLRCCLLYTSPSPRD